MSITDELRKYAEENECKSYCKLLTAIADRIDAEHERITHNLTDALHKQEDATRELSEKSVLLPLDADGVPIHVGDKVSFITTVVWTVTQLRYANGSWQVGCTFENCMNYYHPQTIRHVKSDSWEQIIMDALKEGYDRKELFLMSESRISTADLVARCKALAGEE
jgi:hypothetical protein